MKVIIKNGVYSKNSPIYTMDSIILALHRDNISGICIPVQMTLDKVPIVYFPSTPMGKKVSEQTYQELLKHNIGSRIKRKSILTLAEVLKLFDRYSKKLVIELEDYQEKNLEFIETVLAVIDKYPNVDVYIKSRVKEEILYLREIANNCQIGATITNDEEYFWNMNLDFYSICCLQVDKKKLTKQLENNRLLMFENIQSKEEILALKNSLNLSSDQLYVITDSINNIVGYCK